MCVQGVEYVSFMKLLEVHLAATRGKVLYNGSFFGIQPTEST